MTNTNCLAGVRCPRCRQADQLEIVARVFCRVTDDGSEPFGDHDWDDDSVAACTECGFNGPLGAFRMGLPPDPEGMNDDRAAWAGTALAAFAEVTGADPGDAVCDLLCDLMHWADRAGYGFDAALNRARDHYAAETAAEAG